MRYIDPYGRVHRLDTTGMLSPVQCTHCGVVYDLCSATPVHSYADCTVFDAPCCGRRVDDRAWKTTPDFRRVQR